MLKEYYFTQKLDHFDRRGVSHVTTFQQLLLVNDSLWGGAEAGAPIIVLVGGVSGPTAPPGESGLLRLGAVELKAMLVHIEVRTNHLNNH